jgi:hypothetical protein
MLIAPGWSKGPWLYLIRCSVLVGSSPTGRPLVCLLPSIYSNSPDGSCWEARAPSKAVSSASSNPLYQKDEA